MCSQSFSTRASERLVRVSALLLLYKLLRLPVWLCVQQVVEIDLARNKNREASTAIRKLPQSSGGSFGNAEKGYLLRPGGFFLRVSSEKAQDIIKEGNSPLDRLSLINYRECAHLTFNTRDTLRNRAEHLANCSLNPKIYRACE